MIGKIRRILGLETNDEKLARFNETNNSIAELSRKIDNIAEEFTVKNESFKSLLKSGSLDQQVKQNIQKRYDNFLNYHKQELQPIVKQRRELRKQHEVFLKDSSLFKAIRDINIIGTAKEKYLSGDINQNQFDTIIKARQGKVKYSDIILFNEEGKFLILQRSNEEDDKLANMWGVPGGHVDAGEEFYDAAVRELWEESGITCKEIEEIGIYEDQNVEIHYFIGNVSSKEIMTAIQAGEAQDLKWIHIDDMPDYNMPFNMADNLLKFIKEESDSGYWGKLETALKQGKIEKSFYDELLLKSKAKDKFSFVMKEFSEGKLKSSSGEKVVDRDQAIAIAYSESGLDKSDDLEKAKYIKKEPDGKDGWKYYYKENQAKLEKAIDLICKKINKLKVEHLYCLDSEGNKIFNTTDNHPNKVSIPKDKVEKLKGSNLIHNHPKGNAFSLDDFNVCLNNEIKSTRISVGEGYYVFENNLETKIDLNDSLKEINDNLNKWYDVNGVKDQEKNKKIWVDVFLSLDVYTKNKDKLGVFFIDLKGNKTKL